MATTDKLINASSAAALVTAVNAYLATLVNPVVKTWAISAVDLATRPGISYQFFISTADGGAVLAAPFTLTVLEQPTQPALQSAVSAFRAAQGGQFYSGGRLIQIADDNEVVSRLALAFLVNVNVGAAANYVYQN